MIGSVTTGSWQATRNMAEAVAAPFPDPVLRLGVTGLSPRGQDGVHHLARRQPDRPGADAAAPRRRRGAHPRRLAPAAARRRRGALRLRGAPRRADRARAALARGHAAGLAAAPVAAPRAPGAAGRAARGPGRCTSTSWTTRASGCSTSASSTRTFADWSAGALAKARARPGGGGVPARGSTRPTPRRRWTRRRSRRWPRPTPSTCAPRGGAGSRTARRGGSCCPATWRARPRSPSRRCRRCPRRGAASLWRECERRFEAYKRVVVSPSSATTSPASTGRWCWWTCWARSRAGPAPSRTCAQAMADILGRLQPGAERLARAAPGAAAGRADPVRRDQGRPPAPRPARAARGAGRGAAARGQGPGRVRRGRDRGHGHRGPADHREDRMSTRATWTWCGGGPRTGSRRRAIRRLPEDPGGSSPARRGPRLALAATRCRSSRPRR